MRVLVTGSSGFIGSHVVRTLLQNGHDVLAVDRDPAPGWHERLLVDRFDIADRGLMMDLPARMEFAPEAIVHLAAEASIALGERDPDRMIRSNVTGTVNVVDLAADHSCLLVAASSAAVYPTWKPPSDRPWTAEEVPMPSSLYGWTKSWGEDYAAQHASSLMLRFSNVFGPGQYRSEESGVIGKWVRAAARGQEIHVHGDGQQVRDFVPVGWVVDQILAALEHDPEVLAKNVSTGRATTLRSVVEHLQVLVPALRIVEEPWRSPGAEWSVLEPSDGAPPSGMFAETLKDAYEWERNAV